MFCFFLNHASIPFEMYLGFSKTHLVKFSWHLVPIIIPMVTSLYHSAKLIGVDFPVISAKKKYRKVLKQKQSSTHLVIFSLSKYVLLVSWQYCRNKNDFWPISTNSLFSNHFYMLYYRTVVIAQSQKVWRIAKFSEGW